MTDKEKVEYQHRLIMKLIEIVRGYETMFNNLKPILNEEGISTQDIAEIDDILPEEYKEH